MSGKGEMLNYLALCLRERGAHLLPRFRTEEEVRLLADFSLEEPPPPPGDAARSLTLKEQIETCGKCGPVSERRYPYGSGTSRVMLLLNSPRLLSRFEREHYKKESVEMLKKMMTLLGLNIADTYITNMVKCEVDDPISGPGRAALSCSGILRREIETLAPEIIIVFGDIIPARAIVKETMGIDWFNIEHPITLIRNPDLKRGAMNTLKTVADRLSGSDKA